MTERRPSRRALVLGGVGALVGAAGCDGPGPVVGDRTPAATSRRYAGRLDTRFWPGHRPRWLLAAPPQAAPTGLVVSLHGYGGDATSTFEGGLELHRHVADTGLAVVSVDGGTSYWHARRDGSDTGAMVLRDLVPLALRTVGLPAGSPVTLLGWSMGGFGALWLSTRLPEVRVRAVVAESAAVWLDAAATAAGAFDDREDFERHTPFAHLGSLARRAVRLDCGTADPFLEANRSLASRLPAARATFDDGGHVMDYWRGHAGAQLRWVAAQG